MEFINLSYQLKNFVSVEKLPDFADQIPEDEDDGKEKDDEDLEEAGDDPAGHDRQDSNPADECKNKPMTTEQEDEKANDKTEEEEGTEFDGLQVYIWIFKYE